MPAKRRQVDVKNAEVVKREDYVRTLNEIIAAGFCPFCEAHLFKHHKQPLIYKGRYWLVTKNNWPYAGTKFHFLLISRSHTERTEDLSPAAWKEFHALYRKLARRYRFSGATLMIRSGDTRVTGASVNHLHAHLIVGSPRSKKAKNIRALVGFKK